MFKKEKCPKCKKKINDKYSYCPYCGANLGEDEEDWGMLGKNDFQELTNELKLPFGLNSIFNSVMKNLSKELEGQFNEKNSTKKTIKKDGISISISTFGNGAPRINVREMGKPSQKKEIPKFKQTLFTREKAQEFLNLPREEPKTNLKRLSNKVIYELEIPDVSDLENISIVKLENSIEIKAIGKKKSYSKIIPINLPINNYNLSDGKLVVELNAKS